MELNISGILWVSLSVLLLTSLPYLIHFVKYKKQEKASTESFQEFASTRNLVLDKVQKWRNHYMLGLDLKQNILVYCRFGHYPAQMTINLNEVDHATIDAHYEEAIAGKSKFKKLGYLDILLHFKDHRKPAKSLTVYDERQIRMVSDEPFIAENWVWIINHQLKSVENKTELRLAM